MAPLSIIEGGYKVKNKRRLRAMLGGYKLTIFAAEWAKYGRAAGPKRNLQMAEYANALLAY